MTTSANILQQTPYTQTLITYASKHTYPPPLSPRFLLANCHRASLATSTTEMYKRHPLHERLFANLLSKALNCMMHRIRLLSSI